MVSQNKKVIGYWAIMGQNMPRVSLELNPLASSKTEGYASYK
jgi:hypothetical protein